MPQLTYTAARRRLAAVFDETTDSREAVTITRRGKEPVAVLPLAELSALQTTAHLLQSPTNAARLRAALARALDGGGTPMTADDLVAEYANDGTGAEGAPEDGTGDGGLGDEGAARG